MRFQIHHQTRYSYSDPVFLNPHTVRLKARSDASQRLLTFDQRFEPQPAGLSENLDLDGNSATSVWFEEFTDRLDIETTSVVETLRTNPYDYLWIGRSQLPLRYPGQLEENLQAYRRVEDDDTLLSLALEAAERAGQEAQAFLPVLAGLVHDRCVQIYREEGDPHPAAQTLARGEGSCRDLTMLFMALARTQGFATRFVSGYYASESDSHELHAWAEVYIPGGGWRGYDPSAGLAVTDRHIAVAAGRDYRGAAPVTGSYAGKASSTADWQVLIRPA